MSDEFEAVLARVRDRVVPGEDERDRLATVTDELLGAVEAAVADLSVEADVELVGSAARGTWLAGDRDVDVFVRFPPDLPREDLEAYGLAVGNQVLPDGREEFAEHPYVTGEFEGFAVDLVPCYDLDDATDIRSAVDRTPFHARYLAGRIDDHADDVRVAKQFLAAMGAYGSDLRTRGFSGYLVELLVLEFEGFRGLVEAAADWNPPVRIDPEGRADAAFDDPLVVVDPTDPGRNVAAVLSATNLARLIHYSRQLLAEPRVGLFEPREPDPLGPEAVRSAVRRRATVPVAVRFDAPTVVEDQLYPQLEKALGGIEGELDRRGFDPLRSARFADESAVLFVECEVGTRPAVERHEGPPVGAREHAGNFYRKYGGDRGPWGACGDSPVPEPTAASEESEMPADPSAASEESEGPADPGMAGPFVDGERYVVERPRTFRTPRALLESDAIFEVALGPHVERALRDGYEVLVGEEVAALAEEFGVDLARYFDPRP